MIVVKILIGILLLVLLLIIILMITPINYSLRAEKYSKMFLLAEVSILFGLFGFIYKKEGNEEEARIRLFVISFKVNNDGKDRNEKSKEKKKGKSENKKNKVFIGYFIKYINKKVVLKIVKRIVSIIKYILPDKLKIKGNIGFEDPYHTGMFTALYYLLYSIHKRYDISINTVYDEEVYNGQVCTEGDVVIVVILVIAIIMLMELPGKMYLFKRIILKKGG